MNETKQPAACVGDGQRWDTLKGCPVCPVCHASPREMQAALPRRRDGRWTGTVPLHLDGRTTDLNLACGDITHQANCRHVVSGVIHKKGQVYPVNASAPTVQMGDHMRILIPEFGHGQDDEDDWQPPPAVVNETWEKVWPKLVTIGDDLYAELGRRVSDAMTEAGEDPKNTALFRLRVVQAAWGIRAQAEKARDHG